MSRFDKIPLYLSWAGIDPTKTLVDEYCNRFSELVFQGVIDCGWVPGALDYIREQQKNHVLIVVSATPQEELENILTKLDCRKYFTEIFGAPASKKEAIRQSLEKYKAAPGDCVMFGDARADHEAAVFNEVPFVLRRHTTNGDLFAGYDGKQVNDFTEL